MSVRFFSGLLSAIYAEQATNISGEMFNSLPLNFFGGGQTGNIRGWLRFIQLAPGVSGKRLHQSDCRHSVQYV